MSYLYLVALAVFLVADTIVCIRLDKRFTDNVPRWVRFIPGSALYYALFK
jgi:hypothetical protein